MEYIGKLYGKVGYTYFETGTTSKDYDYLVRRNSELQKQVLNLPVVGNRKPDRYKCLLCERDKFTRKTPHKCSAGFRKRGLKWQPIYD